MALASKANAVRISFKRFTLGAPKPAETLVVLEPCDDKPITQQLREILADKPTGVKLIETLRMMNAHNKDQHVSRKEFRQAIAVLGYSAPSNDINAVFDEIDTSGGGEVDFDELKAFHRNLRNGVLPATIGNGAAILAAKEKATPGEKAAKLAAKLAAKDGQKGKQRALLGATPPRVLPAPPAPAPAVPLARPSAVVTFDSVVAMSPAMTRAARALSPAVKRSLSTISPAMARAAGASELYEQLEALRAATPGAMNKTPSTMRLERWSAIAALEGGARAPHRLEPAPKAMRPPIAVLAACAGA